MGRDLKDHKKVKAFRQIQEYKCAEPTCEFFEKPARQGVCFNRLNATSNEYIEAVRDQAKARMAEVKKLRKINKMETDKKWIRYLESNLECCWMNEDFGLDQLIYLRAQVAKLQARVEKEK